MIRTAPGQSAETNVRVPARARTEQTATDPTESRSPCRWPPKHNVIGVGVSATNYEEAATVILQAAKQREPAVVSLHAVHAVVTSSGDPVLRAKVNRFQMIGPDGQPVRWALNRLHGAGLKDRVYGPEMMLRLCQGAATAGVSIYLYGGSDEVVETLRQRLPELYPGLVIAGAESPPFRQLTPEEDAAVVQRINSSGAGMVFIGLGCPKQDHFAADHADVIQAVQVCVGAAFDFHAGSKSMAPAWMQKRGLEWLFRLCQEPRRLWRRYFVTNSVFVWKCALQWCGVRPPSLEGPPA